MNGTVVVNGDHAENGEIGGSDLLTFKQPALLRNSLDEQIELLLLTWILLLYRGSGSNEDGHVFWSYQLCGKPHSSLPPQASGLITDVVVRGQESILDALERIRRIRRIDEPVENKGRARDGIYIALSNSSELENGSQVVRDPQDVKY